MTKTTSVQQKLPPSPKTPSLVQLLQWATDPIKLLEKSARQYGDSFTLEFYQGEPNIFVSNPDIIREIFSQDTNNFDAGKGNYVLLPLLGKHSTLLSDGKSHSRQRKLLFPPFHGEKIRHYGEKMATITEEVAKIWENGQPFCMRSAMQQITLEVIMQTVFGISDFERKAQLKARLVKSLELVTGSVLQSSLLFFPVLQKDIPASPWRVFLQRQKVIHQLLQAELEQRRNHEKEKDKTVLSLLMQAEDEEGNPMSNEELRDQLMTLLLAGHETTATALTWAFYWIHKFPKVREKLLTELANISNPSDIKALNQLPYFNAVCNETLRIYPVTLMTSPRITKSTLEIGNHQYPPETIFAPCVYLLHHREDLYPHSQQFRPERFLEREFTPYEFIPFGGGSRRCIGDAFASMEMKIVIATVLKNYQLTLINTKPVKPVRRGVTLAPAKSIKMRIDR